MRERKKESEKHLHWYADHPMVTHLCSLPIPVPEIFFFFLSLTLCMKKQLVHEVMLLRLKYDFPNAVSL